MICDPPQFIEQMQLIYVTVRKTGIYSAPFGQLLTHSKQRIHSVPFFLFLELSVTSTSIGHAFAFIAFYPEQRISLLMIPG